MAVGVGGGGGFGCARPATGTGGDAGFRDLPYVGDDAMQLARDVDSGGDRRVELGGKLGPVLGLRKVWVQ